jgi:hypothetical protein
MRFTVEIPETKEDLRKMIELLNSAGLHMGQLAHEKAKDANLIAKAMIKVLEDEPDSDAIRNHRDDYIDFANGYLEVGEYVEYLLWDIHNKIVEKMKEMSDATES